MRRAVKLGYYDKQSATITDLFDDADDAFLQRVRIARNAERCTS